MSLQIASIADHPELLPTIGRWHWEEWGHDDPEGSLEAWTARLGERTHRDQIPTIFVALDDGALAGSAVLCEHDMDTRLDLTPWLSGVFVEPSRRGHGIAAHLVRHAMAFAAERGVGTLYLYTNGAEAVYETQGWNRIGRELYEGRWTTLMAARLGGRKSRA